MQNRSFSPSWLFWRAVRGCYHYHFHWISKMMNRFLHFPPCAGGGAVILSRNSPYPQRTTKRCRPPPTKRRCLYPLVPHLSFPVAAPPQESTLKLLCSDNLILVTEPTRNIFLICWGAYPKYVLNLLDPPWKTFS